MGLEYLPILIYHEFKLLVKHSSHIRIGRKLEPILVGGFSNKWLVLKHIPSWLGIYDSHGAYGSEVDFWWWIDHATTSPSVTWQIFEQVDFSDKHPESTSQAIFPPEVLCLIGMFFWGAFYTETQEVYDGCLGFETWWKNRWKRKRGTRIKPVGIGLMDWIFWVYFPELPFTNNWGESICIGFTGGFIGQRSATLYHYISFAWS